MANLMSCSLSHFFRTYSLPLWQTEYKCRCLLANPGGRRTKVRVIRELTYWWQTKATLFIARRWSTVQFLKVLAPVVRKLITLSTIKIAIPVDKCPLESDLSGGQRYPPFKQQDEYRSFRTHGRFVPRLRRFVPTFGRFVPNPLVDSYPRNYDKVFGVFEWETC